MFERYYQELLGFMSREIGDRDCAADVVQEAYSRVLALESSAAGLPSAARLVLEPRALLYRIAKNILIDQHRRDRVRDHSRLDDPEAAEAAAPAAHQPDVLVGSRQVARRLLAAIDALPPRCKEAFVLYKFDGMSQAEIAGRMGISRNMVEKHVMAGMLACRRCMDADGDTPASEPA